MRQFRSKLSLVPGLCLGRDTAYNLAGAVLPLGVSLATVPLYLRYMGAAEYGVLAIAWLLLGYFGLFNLNFGRVATYFIARDVGGENAGAVFWSVLWASLAAGCVGGAVLLASRPLVGRFAPELAVRWLGGRGAPVLGWLALAVPVTTVSSTLQGSLDGARRFLLNNALKVAGSTLLQVAPLFAAVRHGRDIVLVIAVAVCARAAIVPVYFAACASALPCGRCRLPVPRVIRDGVGFGGWASLQSTLYDLGTTVDQIMIGAVLGPAAVTAFAVPYRFTTRVGILPGALSTALFPRLSAASEAAAERLAAAAMFALAGVSLPVIAGCMLVTRAFFARWLGAAEAAQMAPVALVLLLAAWINGLFYIPVGLMMSRGRAKAAGLLQAANTVVFLALLLVVLRRFGLAGAAWAAVLRSVLGLGSFAWICGALRHAMWRLAPACVLLAGITGWTLLDSAGGAGLAIAAAFACVGLAAFGLARAAIVRAAVVGA